MAFTLFEFKTKSPNIRAEKKHIPNVHVDYGAYGKLNFNKSQSIFCIYIYVHQLHFRFHDPHSTPNRSMLTVAGTYIPFQYS